MILALRMTALAALVLAVLAAATLWRVSQRRAQAMNDFPAQGQFVRVNGHDVHYVQRGLGPDVVLIHGASGNTRDFTFSMVDALSDRYRVTVFDRPGFGHTPALAARGVTLRDQAQLLSLAARDLGIERPIIVGQSFGGAVAMAWAVHHPDHVGAIASGSGATHPWPGTLSRFHRALAHPLIGPVMSRVLAAWVPASYVHGQVDGAFAPQPAPQGYADAIGLGLITRPESLMANAQQRTDLRAELRAQSALYPSVTQPIEILHGTADDIVYLDIHAVALAADAPDAHLTRLPGIGHMPHHVSQPEVIAAIDRLASRAGLR